MENEQNQPMQPHSTSNVSKFNRLLIIALAVLIVLTVSYFVSARLLSFWPFEKELLSDLKNEPISKSSELENLLSFRKEQWGFEFQYPDSFSEIQHDPTSFRAYSKNYDQLFVTKLLNNTKKLEDASRHLLDRKIVIVKGVEMTITHTLREENKNNSSIPVYLPYRSTLEFDKNGKQFIFEYLSNNNPAQIFEKIINTINFKNGTWVNESDGDQDGLSDIDEIYLGSNSKNKDSDGDGKNDIAEFLNKTNPQGKNNFVPPVLKLNTGRLNIIALGPVNLRLIPPNYSPKTDNIDNFVGRYINSLELLDLVGYGEICGEKGAQITVNCLIGDEKKTMIREIVVPISGTYNDKETWKIFVTPLNESDMEGEFSLYFYDGTPENIVYLEKNRKIREIPDQPYQILEKEYCGLNVVDFTDFSPARDSGLHVFDIILGINGKIFTSNDLNGELQFLKFTVGKPVVFNTDRGDFTVIPKRNPATGTILGGFKYSKMISGCK